MSTQLPAKLQTKIDRINKSSKNIKVRTRILKKGGWSVYLDMHIAKKRRTETTNFYLSGQPNFLIDDIKTISELTTYVKTLEEENLTKRYSKKLSTSDVYLLPWCQDLVSKKGGVNSIHDVLTKKLKVFLEKRKATDMLFSDIDDKFCEDFLNYLQSMKLKINSVHKYYWTFSAMLSIAVQQNMISENPAKRIHVQSEAVTPDYLSYDEIVALIATPTIHTELRNGFLLSCFTGLRSSDIRNLQFSNIHDGVITVRQIKTKKFVYVPLTSDARTIIDEQRKKHTGDQVFQLTKSTENGVRLKKWLRSAGVLTEGRKLSFHSARHSCALYLLKCNMPLPYIQRILGHSNISVTMLYQKMSTKDIQIALQQVPSIMSAETNHRKYQ